MLQRVSETARISFGLLGSLCRNRGCDTDVPHDTEINPQICEKANSESACNESHVYWFLFHFVAFV